MVMLRLPWVRCATLGYYLVFQFDASPGGAVTAVSVNLPGEGALSFGRVPRP